MAAKRASGSVVVLDRMSLHRPAGGAPLPFAVNPAADVDGIVQARMMESHHDFPDFAAGARRVSQPPAPQSLPVMAAI